MSKLSLVLAMILVTAGLVSSCLPQVTTTGQQPDRLPSTVRPAADGAQEIVLVFGHSSADIPDLNRVVEKINSYTSVKINTTVRIVAIPLSNYLQQVKLMLTSQETMDLLMTGNLAFVDFAGQANSNQLLALDHLLDRYGQGILEACGEFLVVGEINGRIYGVESVNDEAPGIALCIRQDMVDQYGLDLSGVSSLEDLEDVFAQLKAAGADREMAIFSPSTAADTGIEVSIRAMGADPLGSNYYYTGVLMDPHDISQPIVNFYETETCLELLRLIYRWNQAGYVMPGILTNREDPQTLIRSNVLMSYLQAYHPAAQGQVNTQCATPMQLVEIQDPLSTTERVGPFIWAIPKHSKLPINAMKFLNLMYSDEVVVNLLDWGIEGTHYVKNEDGSISYPEGVSATTSTYPMNYSFIWGNELLSHILAGEDQDMWVKMKAFNETAPKSQALGFTFNINPVYAEYTACLDVYQRYAKALGSGSVDPDVILPEFLGKLKAAGVEKIIAEKQRQLDLFAEQSGLG